MSQLKDIWTNKLFAFFHDPPEKALILGRRPGGHEAGTVKWFMENKARDLGIVPPDGIKRKIHEADYFAASVDRLVLPALKENFVRWYDDPELIHPVSGERIKIKDNPFVHEIYGQQGIQDLETQSQELIDKLLDGIDDTKRMFLRVWRYLGDPGTLKAFRDEIKLGAWWDLLPADMRMPTHSIWDHARITSAFMAVMDDPWMLAVAIGPVQSFIAQARKTTDLWAGSHLLSYLAFQAMTVIIDEFGPDNIIFPDLRGVPLMDLYLADRYGVLPPYDRHPVFNNPTDSNPLFMAGIPNRFLAVVDGAFVEALNKDNAIKQKLEKTVAKILEKTLKEIDLDDDKIGKIRDQAMKQLKGFPDVYFAARKWPENLGTPESGQLRDFVEHFGDSRLFDEKRWSVISGGNAVISRHYSPHHGVLYPAMHSAVEVGMAGAKSVRPFDSQAQQGYRCSVCGEREWLTPNDDLLWDHGGHKQTFWKDLASRHVVKPSERLCSVCLIKRLWARVFSDEVRDKIRKINPDFSLRRFTVSTRTMALVPVLKRLSDSKSDFAAKLAELKDDGKDIYELLPGRLHRDLENKKDILDFAHQAPGLLDLYDELSREQGKAAREYEQKYKDLSGFLRKAANVRRLNTYYGLIMMDGDRMGAILRCDVDEKSPKIKDLIYTGQLNSYAKALYNLDDPALERALKEYLDLPAIPSPAFHAAVSAILATFSQSMVLHVVEGLYRGKVIYSGGDDVLAMAPLDEVLDMAYTLRLAFSGGPSPDDWKHKKALKIEKGYVFFNHRLHRMMGTPFTASAGVVVAHQSTPFSVVLKEARAAESRAKKAGRDRFSISVLKRSGGPIRLTALWSSGVTDVISELHGLFSGGRHAVLSRRFLGAITAILGLFDAREAVRAMLVYHLQRHANKINGKTAIDEQQATGIANRLVAASKDVKLEQDTGALGKKVIAVVAIAEFLSREARS